VLVLVDDPVEAQRSETDHGGPVVPGVPDVEAVEVAMEQMTTSYAPRYVLSRSRHLADHRGRAALVVTTEDRDRRLAITLLMAHTSHPGLQIVVTGQNDPWGALLERAGASDVVVFDDLVAGALVDRLGRNTST
jgi:hypothetical protein